MSYEPNEDKSVLTVVNVGNFVFDILNELDMYNSFCASANYEMTENANGQRFKLQWVVGKLKEYDLIVIKQEEHL